jgi:hypothetical protein
MEHENNGARPEKPIDWSVVEELLEAGCSGVQIAAQLRIHYETLYDRAVKKFGVSWTQYSEDRRTKGDNDLLTCQHKKALTGDNMMLIWLGKNRLKQRDTPQEIEITPATMGQFKDIMVQLKIAQLSSSKIAETNNNTDTKS